jgi:drug/metabolite transporter (DMT)-like permease
LLLYYGFLYISVAMFGVQFFGASATKRKAAAALPPPLCSRSSVQYPFITGGTMIVSAVIALLCGQRPTKKEILSIILSLAGMLMLVFIP